MSDEVLQLHEAILNRLRATEESAEQPTETPDASDYDWTHPHHFTREQLEKITKFSVQVGEKVSEALSSRLRDEMKFQVDPVTQHFAGDLAESLAPGAPYYAAILDDSDQPCGLIVLSVTHAVEWVAKILGGEAAVDASERELTALEYGLLADILEEMVKAFSEAYEAPGRSSFHLSEEVTKGELSLPGNPANEFCRISLRQEGAPPEQSVPFILLCEALEPLTIDELDRPKSQTHIDSHAAIAAHVQETKVTAEAVIGTGEATLQEVLSLAEGDILLIQRRIYEPIELVVDGRAVLAGTLVTCTGRYGLRVTIPSGAFLRNVSAAETKEHPSAPTDRDNDRERNQTDG